MRNDRVSNITVCTDNEWVIKISFPPFVNIGCNELNI
jgi:hypothetical protein